MIPSVVYTHPEIAGVGLDRRAGQGSRHEIKVGKFPFMANSRAKTNRDTDGFVKVSPTPRPTACWASGSSPASPARDRQAAQAMEFGATSEDIAYTCHAHPTHAEALKEAAMAVTGKPIHI